MQIGIIYKWIIYIEKAQNKDTKNQKVIGNIHKIIIGIVNNNSTKTEYIIALLKKYLLKTGIFIGTVYNKERNKKMDIWEKIKRKGFNWWVASRIKKAQEK